MCVTLPSVSAWVTCVWAWSLAYEQLHNSRGMALQLACCPECFFPLALPIAPHSTRPDNH